MHELGIVTHVAKTLDELSRENHLKRIGSVTLQVGEVSGIITDYFVDCWNYFKVRYPVLKDAEMKLETTKAVTFCEDCKQEYETVKYGRTCPYCQSEHTYLVTGNECVIKEIEAEEE
ncbi:MAG: hydrogenase maturation nickel metallochaperone HypA [Erysipelotrichaceae bacterium]|nr:hydrogenase maturation nickel metallochaperone HypA [Erysipelotrichaceae bacterium]